MAEILPKLLITLARRPLKFKREIFAVNITAFGA
jgi:hypothetical protein